MDSFGAVRALAQQKYTLLRGLASGNGRAAALLKAAREADTVTTRLLPSEHPLLAGGEGALHKGPSNPSIYISSSVEDDQAAYIEAHEFGHLWIETPIDPVIIPKGSDPSTPEQPTPLGLRRVEAYSAADLRERLANVFAREFLLPRPEARRLFIDDGKTAPEIARALGVPLGLVHQQLAAALLLPDPPSDTAGADPSVKPDLDESQRAAAEHDGSPLLVEAGPGTGKTRTLIARVEHLLKNGVPAPAILALTFSNKAAREIRERIAQSAPKAAPEIWSGTFHAFGLEVIRKYGHLDGIVEPLKLLDQADQLALLERELPSLGLDHYLRLHEPLLELRHILGAISRAKDELFTPDEYAAAAATMLAAALTDEDRLKANKAAEVARVYHHYESRLRGAGMVDFADLINRPIAIMRAHPFVGDELRGQYQHLLVDEYQDVNRASALLLKELAGEGDRLWVVGDARQSIYRFRGAAPINTRDFEKDYPRGTRKPLEINYRSRQPIVDAFSGYAKGMCVGQGRSSFLEAKRGMGVEAMDCNVAVDRSAEIAGIAATIVRRHSEGVAFWDQAVLTRTHGNLEKIAQGLEALGIPILYLGDLFERPEIRDLLALISFVAEPHRGGLYRVCALKPYSAPLADVKTFLAYASSSRKTPVEALRDLAHVKGLSAAGVEGLSRLAHHVSAVEFKTGPGTFLCDVLFNHGIYLRPHLSGMTAADQQRRLAIHQFLQFAIENNTSDSGDPKRKMLDWIRRLEVFGDERALREPPAAVDGIDAVRLMTVHASKGLEFRVVHLPALAAGMFPLRWLGERCPAPQGMLPTLVANDHKEEEECLFFVALSRARDHLSLSRAQRYSVKQASNACDALKSIARYLPRSPEGLPTWTGAIPDLFDGGERRDLCVTATEHDGRDIELYLSCPRRYLYQVVLGLSGSREDNGYVRFHRAVYRVLHWMGSQIPPIRPEALAASFEMVWQDIGPFDHPLEPLYREAAGRILEQAAGRARIGITFGDVLQIVLDGHTISMPADEVDRTGGHVIVRRLRTGRPPKSPDQRALHALMAEAGRLTHGASFELLYLTTNTSVSPSLSGVMADRLGKTREALANLAIGRFPAMPQNREDCPRCPHYFICNVVAD